MLSLNIPVNLLYRFNITDDFSISPYFGLDFRINLLGKNKYEISYDGNTDSEDWNLLTMTIWTTKLGDASSRLASWCRI